MPPSVVYALLIVAIVLLLQLCFGQIDRLLRAACGAQRVRIPVKRAFKHRVWKNHIEAYPLGLTAALLRLRLFFSRLLSRRKIMRRILSPSLCCDIRDAYCEGLEDPVTQGRLKKYISKHSMGDTEACLEILARRMSTASFTLLSPKQSLFVGLYVCYERDHAKGPDFRLVMGMEFWVLLLYHWATRQPAKDPGRFGLYYRRILRIVFGRMVLEGVAHECIHILQDMREDLLFHEYESSKGKKNALTFSKWTMSEWDAHRYGSPRWLIALGLLLIPLIVMGANSS